MTNKEIEIAIDEIKYYKEFGDPISDESCDVMIALFGRLFSRKPIDDIDNYLCPDCGLKLDEDRDCCCPFCGQIIEWEG